GERGGRREGRSARGRGAEGGRARLAGAGAEIGERGLQLDRRGKRLVEGLAQAGREAERLAQTCGGLEAARRQTGVQLSLLTSELQHVEGERAEQEALRAQAQESLAELRVALAARESALEALERLERDREGYG